MNGKFGFAHGGRLLLRTFAYMKGKRGKFALGMLFASCELGMVFATPVLNEKLVQMVSGAPGQNTVWIVIALFAVLLLAIPLVTLGNYWRSVCSQHSVNNLRKALFAHLQKLPVSTLASYKTGDYLTRLSSDTERAGLAFGSFAFSSLARFLVVFPVSLALLFVASPQIAALAVVYGLVTLALSSLLNPYVKRLEQEARAQVSSSANHLLEAIRGIPIVRVFLLGDMLAERYHVVCERIYGKRVRFRAMNGISYGVIDFFSFSAQAVAFLVAILYLIPAKLDLAHAVYVASLMSVSGDAMLRLSTFLLWIQPCFVAQQRVFDLLDLSAEQERPSKTAPDLGHPVAIDVKNLSFAYGDSSPVLVEVNLSVRRGEHLAIVGGSGGGKTTLMKLLQSFYQPMKGSISFFGVPDGELSLADIRGLCAYVSQDCAIFDGTIGENIAYGKPSASQDEIIAAAKLANIHAFIAGMPDGYDSPVGERGTQLSGGQRQRIAIARAILKNAPILLLDEATAALDSESEREVQAGLANLILNATTIAIAHRLSTVRNADRIVVIEAGRIIEDGTHDVLIDKKGRYFELYIKQYASEAC